MFYVGVDPGATGAIALINEHKSVAVWDAPTMVVGKRRVPDFPACADILHQIRDITRGSPPRCFIERQGSRPGQHAASGVAIGRWEGAWCLGVAVMRWPYHHVLPNTWKPAMVGAGSDKAASIAAARAIDPDADLGRRKDAGRAEAILIAVWGRTRYPG